MSKSILSQVSHLLSFNADGSTNWDLSLGKIQGAILQEMEQNQVLDSRIEGFLDEVYNKVPAGTGLPTPMVVQAVAGMLSDGNLVEQSEFAEKVKGFLERSKRFVSKRGRSGGLFRIG